MTLIIVDESDMIVSINNEGTEIPSGYEGRAFIVDIPEPNMLEIANNKSAIAMYDRELEEVYYIYTDRVLSTDERLSLLQSSMQSADEKYQQLDKVTLSLNEIKQAKLLQLKQMCTEAIYAPFTSVNGYTFGFNEKDQLNFNGQLNKINLWYNQVTTGNKTQTQFDSKFPLSWKSSSDGVVQLSVDEFIQVTNDGEAHLMNNQVKYWQKEAQVLAATTNAEVDAIGW